MMFRSLFQGVIYLHRVCRYGRVKKASVQLRSLAIAVRSHVSRWARTRSCQAVTMGMSASGASVVRFVSLCRSSWYRGLLWRSRWMLSLCDA